MKTSIEVIHARSGKPLPITLTLHANRHSVHVTASAFESVCTLTEMKEHKVVRWTATVSKEVAVGLTTLTGAKIETNKHQNLVITPESYAAAVAEIARLKSEGEVIQQGMIDRENAQPVIYCAWDFLDWGDYKTTEERRIVTFRQTLPEEKKQGYVYHSVVANMDDRDGIGDRIDDWKSLLEKSPKADVLGYNLAAVNIRQITEAEAQEWITWVEKRNAEKAEAEKAVKERKEVAAKAAKEKAAAELKDAYENELFVWDATQVYSSAGNRLLHSLGATFSPEKIGIYTTDYARHIQNANTTFTLRTELAAAGFVWNGDEKKWELPFSEANAEKVIAFLKKYDSKKLPSEAGLQRCWECGSYFSYADCKRNDGNWNEGYCGC